jgi:hypothetical protein
MQSDRLRLHHPTHRRQPIPGLPLQARIGITGEGLCRRYNNLSSVRRRERWSLSRDACSHPQAASAGRKKDFIADEPFTLTAIAWPTATPFIRTELLIRIGGHNNLSASREL